MKLTQSCFKLRPTIVVLTITLLISGCRSIDISDVSGEYVSKFGQTSQRIVLRESGEYIYIIETGTLTKTFFGNWEVDGNRNIERVYLRDFTLFLRDASFPASMHNERSIAAPTIARYGPDGIRLWFDFDKELFFDKVAEG